MRDRLPERRQIHRAIRTRVLRQVGASMLSAALLAGGILPESILQTSIKAEASETTTIIADSDNPYRMKKIYFWHRATSQGTLPDSGRYPVMVSHDGGFFTGSGRTSSNDDDSWSWTETSWSTQNGWFGSLTGTEEFITPYLPSNWEIEIPGVKDGKNENAKKVYFWINGSTNIYAKNDDYLWSATGKCDGWTFYTNDCGGKYAKGLDSNKVHLFYETGGRDPQWKWDDSELWGESDKDYDDGGDFIVWWAETRNLSCVDTDYTVQTNDVMNVKSGVMFQSTVPQKNNQAKDLIITVEPGAVLSVEGTLYNNATIYNYGTIIVQKNSAILSFFPHDKNNQYSEAYGKIICDGGTYTKGKTTMQAEGNLIVLDGGKIDLNRANGQLVLKNGATAEINGTVTAPGSIQVLDSELYVRSNGSVLIGKGRSTRTNQKIATAKTYNAGKSSVSLEGVPLSDFALDKSSIYVTAKSKVTNDGYVYLGLGPMRIGDGATGRIVQINEGKGEVKWKSVTGLTTDKDGNSVTTYKVNGENVTFTYYSNKNETYRLQEYYQTQGKTVLYYRNGAVKTTLKDGSYEIQFPIGEAFVVSRIVYKGGESTKNVVYVADGTTQSVPSSADDFDLAYGDLSVLTANGIESIETLENGSVVTRYLNGNIHTVLGDSWLWQYRRENNANFQTQRYTADIKEYEDIYWNGTIDIRSETFERTTYPEGSGEIQEIYKDLVSGVTTTTYFDGSKRTDRADGTYVVSTADGIFEETFPNGNIHIWQYREREDENGNSIEVLVRNVWKNSSGWYITPAEANGQTAEGYASEGEKACFEAVSKDRKGSNLNGTAWLTNMYTLPDGKLVKFGSAVWLTSYKDGTWEYQSKDGSTYVFGDAADPRSLTAVSIASNKSASLIAQDETVLYNQINPNKKILLENLQEEVPCDILMLTGNLIESRWENHLIVNVYAITLDFDRENFMTSRLVMKIMDNPFCSETFKTLDDWQKLCNVDSIRNKSDNPIVYSRRGTKLEYGSLLDDSGADNDSGPAPQSIQNLIFPDASVREKEEPSDITFSEPQCRWALSGPIYVDTNTVGTFQSIACERKGVVTSGEEAGMTYSELMLYVNDGVEVYRKNHATPDTEEGIEWRYLHCIWYDPENMLKVYQYVSEYQDDNTIDYVLFFPDPEKVYRRLNSKSRATSDFYFYIVLNNSMWWYQ